MVERIGLLVEQYALLWGVETPNQAVFGANRNSAALLDPWSGSLRRMQQVLD